jgi:hypothetical protein
VHRDIGAEYVKRASRQNCLNARKQDAVLVLELEPSLDGQGFPRSNVGEPNSDARNAIARALDAVISYRLAAPRLIGRELNDGVGGKGSVELDSSGNATRSWDCYRAVRLGRRRNHR